MCFIPCSRRRAILRVPLYTIRHQIVSCVRHQRPLRLAATSCAQPRQTKLTPDVVRLPQRTRKNLWSHQRTGHVASQHVPADRDLLLSVQRALHEPSQRAQYGSLRQRPRLRRPLSHECRRQAGLSVSFAEEDGGSGLQRCRFRSADTEGSNSASWFRVLLDAFTLVDAVEEAQGCARGARAAPRERDGEAEPAVHTARLQQHQPREQHQ